MIQFQANQGSELCWFKKSDCVNTAKMTLQHTHPH